MDRCTDVNETMFEMASSSMHTNKYHYQGKTAILWESVSLLNISDFRLGLGFTIHRATRTRRASNSRYLVDKVLPLYDL